MFEILWAFTAGLLKRRFASHVGSQEDPSTIQSTIMKRNSAARQFNSLGEHLLNCRHGNILYLTYDVRLKSVISGCLPDS